MESILKKMQDTACKYARILSQILKVDIEIVDNKLYRVAGTGMFENKLNIDMSDEGYVYQKVIKTGEKAIIKKPGKDKICFNCPKINQCDEFFEMSTPIKLDDIVIGVIGFVCFTEKQKNHIMENYEVFLEFLDQISDLISSKAQEIMEQDKTLVFLNMLNDIFDKVDQGIIIYDKNNKIVKINKLALKILDLKDKKYFGKNINLESTEKVLGSNNYRLKIDKVFYNVLGKEYKVYLKSGGYNNIFIFEDINDLMDKALSLTHSQENVRLTSILGSSIEILEIKKKAKKISRSFSTVLITGESGTGKELFARGIHQESMRKDNTFVTINCAAIPDTLLESELFGYVKGAFTGANPNGKIGKIEFANKGTLFLDEIGDMPLYLQAKLLRVLEQREIIKLGSNKTIPVDVRFIAATNRDIEKMIENNNFRKDLYYRLNVIPLEIPPLRERKGDIRELTIYFINKFSRLFNKSIVEVEEQVWDYFNNYNWPGNVRELQNTIEYMVNMAEHHGTISSNMIPHKIINSDDNNQGLLKLEEIEKQTIKKALKIYEHNSEAKMKAAEGLGIGVATLYRKIKKYNL